MEKKRIIISVICVLFLTVIFIKPIKLEIYKLNYNKEIKDYLKSSCKYYNKSEMFSDYGLTLKIYMKENFGNLDFEEQERIIKNISKNCKYSYDTYKKKCSEIKEEVKKMNGDIYIYVNDYNYCITFGSSNIYKNGDKTQVYGVKENLRERILERLSKIPYNQDLKDNTIKYYLNSINDIEMLKELLKIENYEELRKETIYQYLKLCCSKKEYSDSIDNYFRGEILEYKDSKTLLEKMENYAQTSNNSKLKHVCKSNFTKSYDSKDWERFGKYHKYIGYTKKELVDELGKSYYTSKNKIVYTGGYTTAGLTSSIRIQFEFKDNVVNQITYYDQSADHGTPTYID